MMKYLLLDANVIIGYYLKRAAKTELACDLARCLIESVREKELDAFLYVPNFCIAEVFGAFMKHSFATWNNQVDWPMLDKREHKTIRNKFQSDIHNAHLFYHLELNRYHILGINLIAPLDHHYQLGKPKKRKKKSNTKPAGTFDSLIISMGIQLTKIHGPDSVCIVTTDSRLAKLVEKCKTVIPEAIKQKLGLLDASAFTGIPFDSRSFPDVIDLSRASFDMVQDKVGGIPEYKKINRRYWK